MNVEVFVQIQRYSGKMQHLIDNGHLVGKSVFFIYVC